MRIEAIWEEERRNEGKLKKRNEGGRQRKEERGSEGKLKKTNKKEEGR